MIDSLVSFGLGAFFGAVVAVVALALCNAASTRDDWRNENESYS